MVDTIPRALPSKELTAEEDGLNDLFNYDASSNDPFGDDYQPGFSNEIKQFNNKQPDSSGIGLGIDEKVEVTRKPRAPRVKLDENLLLSPAGISKLRLRMKNLSFRGKGHEFNDTSKLLNIYQLWLDDLFPKARFLDAISAVERLGHKKQILVMRMSLINEGMSSLNPIQNESLSTTLPTRSIDADISPRRSECDANTTGIRNSERPQRLDQDNLDQENLYDATPEPADLSSNPTTKQTQRVPEDELDALLAEEYEEHQPTHSKTKNSENLGEIANFNFDEDEEAMAEMEMT